MARVEQAREYSSTEGITPSLRARFIDEVINKFSAIVKDGQQGSARVGFALMLATTGIAGLVVPDAVQLSNGVRNPAKVGKVGDPARGNSQTSEENAAGIDYRLYLPENSKRALGMSNGVVIPREGPTPVPTATPKASEIPPTPTSVVTPDKPTPTPVLESLVGDWPTNIKDAMSNVILPSNVRQVRSRTTPPDQPNCTRACYMQHSKEVWVIDPPLHPNPSPETLAIVYELGHGHQQAITEKEGKKRWEETTEYQEFLTTLNKVNAILRARGDAEWKQEPYHLFVNIWTGYFMGDPNFKNAPTDWRNWVPDPYQPHLVDWKLFMDKWVRK